MGDAAGVRRALAAGAEPQARVSHGDWAGFPPLAIATLLGHTSAAAALLAAGAPVDASTPRGRTPLMVAAELGLDDLAALLLEAGADPAARDPQGRAAADLVDPQRSPELAAGLARAKNASGGPPPARWAVRLQQGARRGARWASRRAAHTRLTLSRVRRSLASGVTEGTARADALRRRARGGRDLAAARPAPGPAVRSDGPAVRYDGPPTHRLRVLWEHAQRGVTELTVGRLRQGEGVISVALSGESGRLTVLAVSGQILAGFPLPAPARHLAATGDLGHGLLVAATTGARGRAEVYDLRGTVVARLPRSLLPAGLAWTAPPPETPPAEIPAPWPPVTLLYTGPTCRVAAFRPEGLRRWRTAGISGGRAVTSVPTAPPPPAVAARMVSAFRPATDPLAGAAAAVSLPTGGVTFVLAGGPTLRTVGRDRLERVVILGPPRAKRPASLPRRWPRVVGVTRQPARPRSRSGGLPEAPLTAPPTGMDGPRRAAGPHLVALDAAGHTLWRAPCLAASPLAVGWVWAGDGADAPDRAGGGAVEDALDDAPGWEPWLAYVDRAGDVVVLDPRARRRALLRPAEEHLERPTSLAWFVWAGGDEGAVGPVLPVLLVGHGGGVTACALTPLDD